MTSFNTRAALALITLLAAAAPVGVAFAGKAMGIRMVSTTRSCR